MPTREQIAEWRQAGKAVRDVRTSHRTRTADEIKALEAAAETASLCADCFEPLSPDTSVSLVTRFVEHIPARRHELGMMIPAKDVHLVVPICLSCWLRSIEEAENWYRFRGVPRREHIDRAEPVRYPYEIRRLRCEGCGRPMRVHARQFNRLTLSERCCCNACFRKASLRRANDRRRVRHEERACVVCGSMFMPKQSTAKTCSNTCRQRLWRQQHARGP